MNRIFSLLIVLSAFALFLFSCDKDSTGVSSEGSTGRLSIYLTDAPGDYDSVAVTFSQISAHIDSEWVHVMVDTMRVNLLDWANGETFLLSSSEVPAGKYTQVRIIIDSAEIGVDGQVYPLEIPSGAQTGLKFGPQFTISEGQKYELVLDFDVCRSIIKTGAGNYKLKPRIRVIAMAVTGSISGTVLNPVHLPVSYAIAGADTVTSSIVDPTDGKFVLAFLPEDIYKVVVEDTMNRRFEQDSVVVVKGQNHDLGEITLQ